MNIYLKNFIGAAAVSALIIFGITSPADAAPLSAARLTASKNGGAIKSYLMKASTTIYAGGMVMLNSVGTAEPAAASASAKGVVGVSLETKSSGSVSTQIQVQEGWFLFDGTTLAQSNQGALCYASDDHTVDDARGTNYPLAGVLIQYVGASSAWVYVGPSFAGRMISEIDTLAVDGATTATGAIYADGGVDRSTAAGLAIGGANATNVTITPATNITGLLSANGGLDRSTAAGLAIGASNATSVTITPATTVTGNLTVGSSKLVVTAASGNTTVAGTLVSTGAITGPSGAQRLTASTLVLTAAMSGNLIVVNNASDAATTITLPAAATAGLHYCFSADAVSGSNREIDVEPPAGSDLIIGTTNPAGGTGIATTAGSGHGMKNTHATAVRGNELCLQSDGTNTWYETALVGTWAGY